MAMAAKMPVLGETTTCSGMAWGFNPYLMSADQFQDNFRELTAQIKDEDEVILLCDILGGSPMTKSLEVLSERGLLDTAIVLTGMNMPMAMTAVIMKDVLEDREALKNTIISESQNAVAEFKPVADDDADDDI